MNTETEFEHVTRQPARRFSLGDCALVSVWVLLMYEVFLAAASNLNREFLDAAVFGGAVLCVRFEKMRATFVTAIAIPLFGLAVWMRIPPLSAGLLALGCGGVAVLTYHAILGSQVDQQNLRIAALLPMFVVLVAHISVQITLFTPHLYDAELLKFDCGISAAVRRWTLAGPLRLAAIDGFYEALPVAASLAIAHTAGRARRHLLRALCLAALLSVPCYFLMPAVGPVHIGQPFAARNCMPSLHLAWAALLWLNARLSWLRWFLFGFVLVTALATLGTGEHYVLDLVAAVPFTWVVQQLSQPRTQ